MKSILWPLTFRVACLLAAATPVFAQAPARPSMATPVSPESLDAAAFAEWEDGMEKPLTGKDRADQAPWVIWTTKSETGHSGRNFGDSKKPGIRHLRIGFSEPVAVGSVFVRGGGRLSVLKEGVAYPGELQSESLWLPAKRILVTGEPSSAEVGPEEFAVWTLPPGTRTRALRFTHDAPVSDPIYTGFLGGAFVVEQRLANAAPQAQAGASANAQHASRINNGNHESNRGWTNIESRGPSPSSQPLLSPEHAPWVMLSWPWATRIDAINALEAGFGSAEVQWYAGPNEKHPRDADESEWKSAGTFQDLKNGYPVLLWPNLLRFPQPVVTRAIRVRMTSPTTEGHPHLKGETREGKRAWLGELMALQAVEGAELFPVTFEPVTVPTVPGHPPIPIRFHLDRPGFVTLVIEDQSGKRVRNLVLQQQLQPGDNTAWWDGTDDLGRDVDAARHGVYKIPAQFVAPGEYKVRGLTRGVVEPHYEFPVYSAGNPVWETADKSGGWLTNHTPPQAALFVSGEDSPTGVPMIYLGSAVSEGGAGLAWVDLEGRKVAGRGWIGGNWTAAPNLARDARKGIPDIYAYVGATWTASSDNRDQTHGELRITGLSAKGDRPIIKYPFTPPAGGEGDHQWIDQLGGIAAYDGLIVASLNKLGSLLFISAREGRVLGEAAVENPRGVAFDREGRLLVLSRTRLLRYAINANAPGKLPESTVLVGWGLEDPRGLTLDEKGNIAVSDWGESQQVKIFTGEGRLIRTLGKSGAPKAGPYDPLHMNHPAGMAMDANSRLWVTENDYLPKRVSVWNADGTLWKAFYGPAKYGGGGTLDSQDKTRLWYADEGRGAMEFKLDWEKGESQLTRVFFRPQPGDQPLPTRAAAPELALYRGDQRYFSNCYNSSPTNGQGTAVLFVEKDGLAQPVAAMGRAKEWEILQGSEFASKLPPGTDWNRNAPFFIWSDANDDGRVQPAEVAFIPGSSGGITVLPDLSFCIARLGEKAMRLPAAGFSPGGAPLYDFNQAETLVDGVLSPASSGGDQLLVSKDGWTVLTLGAAPFSRLSLSGARDGVARWSYPSVWPGLHAAHEAPAPESAGELIGTTRLLGGFVEPKGSDAGQIWGVNANMGTIYLFTADGLFVATVFEDKRQGKSWAMPVAQRNMSLAGFTLGEENFWPTMTQANDGKIYVMNGGRASLIRLDGLESIRRLAVTPLKVSAGDLQNAQSYLVAREAERQQKQGRGVLEIPIRQQAPIVNGKLDDWEGAPWVDIDQSGVAANFNSNSKPYDVTAALTVAGGKLYAAYRTGDDKLLQNSGEVPNAPFKTGGALDLMLSAGRAPATGTDPRPGDLRLLVTRIGGKTRALIYRAVVPGTKEPVPFSSPWRTITLDRVDDVSDQVEFAMADGNYELSIPLQVLGLQPKAGTSIKADVGILRGDGATTTARVYWSNKATGITSDVPSEAALTPQLWGRAEFRAAP